MTGCGLIQIVRMVFGLCNAPDILQALIDELFADLETFLFRYIEDLILNIKNLETHIHILKKVFSRLQKNCVLLSNPSWSICRSW